MKVPFTYKLAYSKKIEKDEGIENIFMQVEEEGYYFENKQGDKFLGFFSFEDEKAFVHGEVPPFQFYKQKFEQQRPEIILCEILLKQENGHLFVYETQNYSGYFIENYKDYLLFKGNSASLKEWTKTNEDPDNICWNNRIEEVLNLIENGVVSKVVCSRSVSFKSCQNKEPSRKEVFKTFYNPSPTFKISFPSGDNERFYSFTPEKIFMSTGKKCFLEAIAGTRPRSKDPSKDKILEQELLDSNKDNDEHQKVINQIQENMKGYGDVSIGETSVLKLKGIQHLRTPIELGIDNGNGKVKSEDTELEKKLRIIQSLHPTPAVGGCPQEVSQNIIKRVEGDREYYAGLFGVISQQYAEVAVLIRSFLCKNNTLTAYAGAGIVKNSNPQEEWKETQDKLRSFLGEIL